jgi:hypothetical protein
METEYIPSVAPSESMQVFETTTTKGIKVTIRIPQNSNGYFRQRKIDTIYEILKPKETDLIIYG